MAGGRASFPATPLPHPSRHNAESKQLSLNCGSDLTSSSPPGLYALAWRTSRGIRNACRATSPPEGDRLPGEPVRKAFFVAIVRNAFTNRRWVTSQLGLLQDPREGDETIKIGRRQSKSAFLFLAVLPELVSQSSTAGKRRSRKSLPRMRKAGEIDASWFATDKIGSGCLYPFRLALGIFCRLLSAVTFHVHTIRVQYQIITIPIFELL